MLAVKKELLTKLAKARGVNLLHLEDVLRFWRDFFCREHLAAEEEFLFKLLYEMDHPALEALAAEHKKLQQNLDELEQISKKLRVGKPNSGREFFEAGEKFVTFLERHLNKENSIFAELVLNKTQQELFAAPFPSEEELSGLTGLFSLLDHLSQEYLGKEYKVTWLERGRTGEKGGTVEESEQEQLNLHEQQREQRKERQEQPEQQEQQEQRDSDKTGRMEEENGAGADKDEKPPEEQNTLPEQAGIEEQKEKI